MKGRAEQRGKPLDVDCKKANISTHEFGVNDDRKFCFGIIDSSTDEVLQKCFECGAYCMNAEPETIRNTRIKERKNCQYRHENGNCLKVGGFCTAVDDKYCELN